MRDFKRCHCFCGWGRSRKGTCIYDIRIGIGISRRIRISRSRRIRRRG